MAKAVGAGARTLGSWARGGFTALSLYLLVGALSLLYGAAAAQAQPSVSDIIANARSASGVRPGHVTFRQDIELRVLLFRWSFYADVTRNGDDIDVQVHGAPSFLSSDVSASLLEVSEGLDSFDLEFVERSERLGDVFYVLRGVPKQADQAGAQGGTIWINARTWLVERATLHYSWGNMTVEQTFQAVNGFTLLREQHASVDRLGAKLRVQYGGYSFGEH